MEIKDVRHEKYVISWDEKEGIIKSTLVGTLSANEARFYVEKLRIIIDSLKKEGVKTIYWLNDASKAGIMTDPEFRQIFIDCLKEFKDAKIAIHGLNEPKKIIVNFLISFSKIKNVKFFTSEEEALKWIREEKKKKNGKQ